MRRTRVAPDFNQSYEEVWSTLKANSYFHPNSLSINDAETKSKYCDFNKNTQSFTAIICFSTIDLIYTIAILIFYCCSFFFVLIWSFSVVTNGAHMFTLILRKQFGWDTSAYENYVLLIYVLSREVILAATLMVGVFSGPCEHQGVYLCNNMVASLMLFPLFTRYK